MITDVLSPNSSSLVRLPGRRLDGTSSGTLWLTSDHLLQVQNGFTRESYRRFAYRDIQALGLRRTSRGTVYNGLLGGVGLLFTALAALVFSASTWATGVFVGVAAFFFVLLALNVVRGPTVRCDPRTAVGLYPLPSLSRMRPARRALELIRQRVETAQGALSEATLAERAARALHSFTAVPAAAATTTTTTPATATIAMATTANVA